MRPDFPRFVGLISKGLVPSIAFAQVYGRSLPDIQSALRAYLKHLPICSVALNTPSAERQIVQVVASSGDEIESEVMSANFLGTSQ